MSKTTISAQARQAWIVSVQQQPRDPGFWADWTAVVALVLLVIVFGIASPTFLSWGNVQAILVASAILVMLSVGQTYVIITGGIDLSVASALTLGSVVLGQAVSRGWSIALACVLAVIASTVVGVINGVVIAKGKITDFIVTLGTLSAAAGVALILSNGEPVTVTSEFLLRLATGSLGPIPYFVIVAAVVAIVAHVVLFHSRFGTHLLATGGEPEAARAMGINTDRVKIAAYVISGFLAGVASILLTARIGAAEPAANTSFLLNSVAAVVLGGVSLFGGRGTIVGPVVGALLLTALVNGLTLLGVSQFYQQLAIGIVVVLQGLAQQAAASGITLGLEVVNRYESNLLNTAKQALALIAEVGADNLVVHLDTYHMNIEESDFTKPVLACGDRLGYVHVGESHRGYLGTGTVDFPAFFGALAAINYQGTVTFESFSSAVVAPGLSTTLAIWRNTWTNSADLARRAREFIDAGLLGAQVAPTEA